MNEYDRKRQELREGSTGKILDAAVRLFGENGYVKTSVREIADLAEVSLALVFKYFGSKEKLLSEAYRYATDIAYPLQGEEPDLRVRTENLIRQSVEIMNTRPEIFDFFMMLLCTSDLPGSYQATGRELFRQTPVCPVLEAWRKEKKLPGGDPYDDFLLLMRTVYAILDFYRKMRLVKGGEGINVTGLLNHIFETIEGDMTGGG